jgi:ATP-dependent exoDNAse (exonuclease V) beta subunit
MAILCPRKKWFAPIADALREIGIDSQIQSETDIKGDSPAHAWFTALLTIMTQPRCGFEIIGVLREVFGISDHELAIFCEGHGDRFQIQKATRTHAVASAQAGDSGLCSSTLDLLARIHTEIADEPLFSAVERIVEATHLWARLRALPREDFENLDGELDVLLQSAATAEPEGKTLEQFAELLRANFTAERETGSPRSGAIQLITCQKAKGLEWDAVVVPFFSRHIYTGEEDFPRLIVDRENEEVIVAFSKGDLPARAKDALKQARIHEMERLLYVALTRARHTMVLAADGELFGPAPTESLVKWFRSDQGQPNAAHVTKLPVNPIGCSRTRAHDSLPAQTGRIFEQAAKLSEPVLSTAKSRAEAFFHQLNPSGFITGDSEIERTGADALKEAEIEFRARTLPSAATRYGVWWHDFVQNIAWGSQPEAWQAACEQSMINSPEPARSKREWKLLTEYISKHPEFFAGNIFAEMPFFWRMTETQCLEGIIDLASYDSKQQKWFILDWKTNQVKRDQIDRLRTYYRAQIAAYWKATTEMTRQPVGAGIYSTATGRLLIYDETELAEEWERLKNVATQQVAAEMAREENGGISRAMGQLEFRDW